MPVRVQLGSSGEGFRDTKRNGLGQSIDGGGSCIGLFIGGLVVWHTICM